MVPNQNPIESDNKTIKRYVKKRASFDYFLNQNVPKIFKVGEEKWTQQKEILRRQPEDQVAEILHQPIPRDCLLKARLFIQTCGTDARRGSMGKFDFALNSTFFNTTAAIDQPVTERRALLFHTAKYASLEVEAPKSVCETFAAMISGNKPQHGLFFALLITDNNRNTEIFL